MKIVITDHEAVSLLSILNERNIKYKKLAELAKCRIGKNKFSKNAERLMEKHNGKVVTAQNLIDKIAGQL